MKTPKTRPLSAAATLDIGLDRTDSEPFQSQIARQIRALVLGGRLKPGAKLPSSRMLSDDVGVARATVVEAYEQLVGEGYLDTRLGSGTMVAAQLPEDLLTSGGNTSGTAARSVPAVQKREPARPFRSGLVDWEQFPHDAWGRILGRSWRNPPISLLEHNDAFGWMPLRKAIAHHLYEWRGIACDPEQVIVTAGGTDAFDLIRRAVFKPGDRLWLEDPGYPTARRIFASGGVEVDAMAIDGDGLNVAEAIVRGPSARGAFVTPARQYPTGVTMPLTRRLELLQWANAANTIIVEDDYDSEYRYVGRPLPALTSLDRDARVIYSGTFSKVFSPIIRLGFIVVPKRLLPVFRHERMVFGAPPSLVVQPALAQFMEAGDFAVHIRRMRRLYAARRDCLIAALAPGAPRLFSLEAPPSGLMVLLRLAPHQDDEVLAQALALAGVDVQTLSSHSAGPEKSQGLLLSFAGFHEADLEAAAARLITVLERGA
jgi:GntR family transcriptional regulator / MocR family aminotransferase